MDQIIMVLTNIISFLGSLFHETGTRLIFNEKNQKMKISLRQIQKI